MFLLDKYLLFGATQEDNFANMKDRNLAKRSVDAAECENRELFMSLFSDGGHKLSKGLSKLTERF